MRIGHEAAALLTRMIGGSPPPYDRQVIEPLGIVTRRSTDILAVDDKTVAAALRFIHDHACDGIGVPDIVKHVPVSRSTLERRFVRTVGKSPQGGDQPDSNRADQATAGRHGVQARRRRPDDRLHACGVHECPVQGVDWS